MIEKKRDALEFSFPEVHPDAKLTVEFQRTLRIPDDGKKYPLPPGLGRFPLRHVDDSVENVPSSWIEHGGVMLPMYQCEALWLQFDSHLVPGYDTEYPFAIKISAGKVNAVNGDPWTEGLSKLTQDYVVAPTQPWIDGYYAGPGLIRQFVAMPLGEGYTAEEQITGEGKFGGLQIAVYPMKRKAFESIFSKQELTEHDIYSMESRLQSLDSREMGLAPGGAMRQEIYDDPHEFKDWDRETGSRCFVHILNSTTWSGTTGELPPTEPRTAQDYSNAGLPWFDYYAKEVNALAHPSKLTELKGIGKQPTDEDGPVKPPKVIHLVTSKDTVREGKF